MPQNARSWMLFYKQIITKIQSIREIQATKSYAEKIPKPPSEYFQLQGFLS
jgi:hypothetical protein